MTTVATLSRYMARQYLLIFLAVLAGLFALVLLIDSVELLRRASSRSVPVGMVFWMTLLKLPEIGFQMFPFAVLFSAMYLFWKLTKTRELVVVRAFGVSAWQFLLPVLAAAAVIGMVQITLVTQLGAAMLNRYEQLEARYLQGRSSTIDVGRSGIWLSQIEPGGAQALINAGTIAGPERELQPFSIVVANDFSRITVRVEGAGAVLEPGAWRIRDAWVQRPNAPAEFHPVFRWPTDMTMERLESSFAPPETIGFWDLPGFIVSMEAAGLSALRHRLHYQSMLSQPVVLAAMVLFAAVFTLRLSRGGSPLIMVVAGIATGFVLFVMRDVVLTLGQSGTLPVPAAAWMPAMVSLLFGAAILLHLEDG